MKVFLAGSESYFDLIKKVQPRYVLMSYYYLRGKKNVNLKELYDLGIKVFIDSGGFTFRVKHGVSSVPKEYIDEYANWLIDNQDYVFAYANVDVVDVNETLQNQRYLEEEYGLSPLPVWHYGEGFDLLKDYVQSYDYVALGGFAGGSRDALTLSSNVLNTLRKAKEYNPDVKLHVFGYAGDLKTIAGSAYSCDVSSWIAGRYGAVSVFKNNRIEMVHWKDGQILLSNLAVQYGLDPEAVKVGDYKVLNEISMREWKKAQDFYDTYEPQDIFKVKKEIDDLLMQVKVAYGIDLEIEELLRFLIEEKLKRYLFARKLEEEQAIIDRSVTQLEDSLAQLVEKYIKIKYPERFRVLRVKEEKVNEANEAYQWEKKLEKIEEIFKRSAQFSEEDFE